MSTPQPNNPLHGLTLERILNDLVTRLGWAELGRRVRIRCFTHEPSVSSSLKFLRRTPWAREQVEALYLETVDTDEEDAPASRRKEGAREAGRLAANEP